jgi:hypothetical protein
LCHTDAVGPHTTSGLGSLACQLVHLLALLFSKVAKHIASVRIQKLLGLRAGRRLVEILLSLIVIGLVDILGLAVLLKGLLLLRSKTSNRLSRQVEWGRRCLLRLPKCLAASSNNLRVWYILGGLCLLLSR